MQIPPVAQKMIDIRADTQKTEMEHSMAVLAKQLDAAKSQGKAMVELIEQVASAGQSRGLDVLA